MNLFKLITLASIPCWGTLSAQTYQVKAPLLTPFTQEINPKAPLQEYPRPQLQRNNSKMYQRMEIIPLIDWSQEWTTADRATAQLPVKQSKEEKEANRPKPSSYHITNYFDVKDAQADHCVSTYGLNNCEIYINDVRFRKTAGNFSALLDRSYDCYAITGEDLKLLKPGKNKIELKFDQRGGNTYFDAAVFIQKD